MTLAFAYAKASFLTELGLVLRDKIAVVRAAKATKRRLKNLFFKLGFRLHESVPSFYQSLRMSAPTARSTAVLMLAIPYPVEPARPGTEMIAGSG